MVIGGVAADVHGSARITSDLDICYDPSSDNVRTLARVLRDSNAYLRGGEGGLPFVMDEKTFRVTPVMTLTTNLGDIDVMDSVSGIGSYQDVLADSEEIEIGGNRVRVLSLPALITAKRATGRRKDKEHLLELEALLALRKRP